MDCIAEYWKTAPNNVINDYIMKYKQFYFTCLAAQALSKCPLRIEKTFMFDIEIINLISSLFSYKFRS